MQDSRGATGAKARGAGPQHRAPPFNSAPKPPPRPPSVDFGHSNQREKPQNSGPNLLRIGIICITVVGLLFSLRAITTARAKNRPSTANQNSEATQRAPPQGGAGQKEVSEPGRAEDGGVAKDASANSRTPPPPPADHGMPAVSEEGSRDLEGLYIARDSLISELSAVEKQHAALVADPDMSVYENIAVDLRYAARMQMAILQNSRSSEAAALGKSLIQDMEDDSTDPPYYTETIARYSQLLAASAVGVASGMAGKPLGEDSCEKEFSAGAAHGGYIEQTRNAAFITACAFLQMGRLLSTEGSGKGADWSGMANTLQSGISSKEHVVRKTELAHQYICDALLACIKASDRSSEHSQRAAIIYAECQKNVATGGDAYHRIAARTHAELGLMLLLAETL